MIEKIIYFEGIDPVHLYGVNNSNFEIIKKNFPKIKIIARGNEIKVIGEENEISRFEEKIHLLTDYYHKFNSLNENDIEELLLQNSQEYFDSGQDTNNIIIYGRNGKAIKPITATQRKAINAYKNNDLIIAIGPAGSGKTYIAIALAVKALRDKQVKKIILTRPAVEAGEHLGFLPGDLKEKLDPYLQPLYDALHDMIPSKRLKDFIEDGVIQIAPLAFMRGRTLDNACVILDEAQNATKNQIKMFLTRMGKNAKFILTGDITQIDLPNRQSSGLLMAIKILKNIKGISILTFNEKDIIRHKLVKYIVEAYGKSTFSTDEDADK